MRLGLDSFPEFGVPSVRAGTILVHLVLFGAIWCYLVLFGARALKASTLVPWLAAAARVALGATVLALCRGSRGLRTK